MNTSERFDFQRYVAIKKNPGARRNERGFGEYAFAGDVRVLNTLHYARPVRMAAEATVRVFKSWSQSSIIGHAVKVTPRSFPSLYESVAHCASELAIPVPTVFVTSDIGSINAHTFGTDQDSFIVLHSALLERFTPEEIRYVIGHECGHIQNSHVTYLTALHFITHMAGIFVKWVVTPARVALMGWNRRAEITCDRAGLLCCRDVDVAVRAMMKTAVGNSRLADQVNMEEYLAQTQELKQGFGRVQEYFLSHPYLPKRIQAMQLFAESEYFRSLLGQPGGTPLVEVDKEVERIVSVL